MPFCRDCGKSMTADMRYCGGCGADNVSPAAASKPVAPAPLQAPPKKQSSGKLFVAALVLIIFIGIISSNKSTPTTSSTDSEPAPVDVKELLLKQVRLQYSWTKEGFGSFMTANFTVTNPTGIAFKDFEITCKHTAPSGTEIDSNVRTIYEVVVANSTWKKQNFDMGFIHSQAQKSSCSITDLVPVT
jgi:hypothetical protein